MNETEDTTENPTSTSIIELTFIGFNISAKIQNVNPMQLWAAARWLQQYGDMLNEQQMMANMQRSQGNVLEVARSFPGGLHHD